MINHGVGDRFYGDGDLGRACVDSLNGNAFEDEQVGDPLEDKNEFGDPTDPRTLVGRLQCLEIPWLSVPWP
jgi:hypothetical protein